MPVQPMGEACIFLKYSINSTSCTINPRSTDFSRSKGNFDVRKVYIQRKAGKLSINVRYIEMSRFRSGWKKMYTVFIFENNVCLGGNIHLFKW